MSLPDEAAGGRARLYERLAPLRDALPLPRLPGGVWRWLCTRTHHGHSFLNVDSPTRFSCMCCALYRSNSFSKLQSRMWMRCCSGGALLPRPDVLSCSTSSVAVVLAS